MGTEFSGYTASSPTMLTGSSYLVVPTGISGKEHVEKLTDLIRKMEARPITVQGEQHDRALAVISHLPHVAAASLSRVAAEEDKDIDLKQLCAGGFKDITRISSSSPELWAEISLENRENVLSSLEKLEAQLADYKALLTAKDMAGLTDFFAGAKAYRDQVIENANSNRV